MDGNIWIVSRKDPEIRQTSLIWCCAVIAEDEDVNGGIGPILIGLIHKQKLR